MYFSEHFQVNFQDISVTPFVAEISRRCNNATICQSDPNILIINYAVKLHIYRQRIQVSGINQSRKTDLAILLYLDIKYGKIKIKINEVSIFALQ